MVFGCLWYVFLSDVWYGFCLMFSKFILCRLFPRVVDVSLVIFECFKKHRLTNQIGEGLKRQGWLKG